MSTLSRKDKMPCACALACLLALTAWTGRSFEAEGVQASDAPSTAIAGKPTAIPDYYVHHPTVISVTPNSAADKAGLHRGDTIVSVNGKAVESAGDCSEALDRARDGGTKLVMVVRSDGVEDRTVELPAGVKELGFQRASSERMDFWEMYCRSGKRNPRWEEPVREGLRLLHRGEFSRARQSLGKAEELGLNSPVLCEALARACLDTMDYDGALKHYARAAEMPGGGAAALSRFEILEDRADFESFVREIEALKSVEIPHKQASYCLACQLNRCRRCLKWARPASEWLRAEGSLRAHGLLPDIAAANAALLGKEIVYRKKPLTKFVVAPAQDVITYEQYGDFVLTVTMELLDGGEFDQGRNCCAELGVIDDREPGLNARGILLAKSSARIPRGGFGLFYPNGLWLPAPAMVETKTWSSEAWANGGRYKRHIGRMEPEIQAGRSYRLKAVRRGSICDFFLDDVLAVRLLVGNRPLRVLFDGQDTRVRVENPTIKVLAPDINPHLKPAEGDARAPAAGLRVAGLVAGGHGQWLGMREGDLIVGLAGAAPATVRDLERLLFANRDKPSVRLAVLRDGARLEADIAPRDLGAVLEPVRDGLRLYREGRFADGKFDAAVEEGYARLGAGDCQAAAGKFAQAVDAGLADPEVLADLMECFARLGQFDKATEAGRKASETAPDRVDLAMRLVLLLVARDTLHPAQAALDRLRKRLTDPEDEAWAQCMAERMEAMTRGRREAREAKAPDEAGDEPRELLPAGTEKQKLADCFIRSQPGDCAFCAVDDTYRNMAVTLIGRCKAVAASTSTRRALMGLIFAYENDDGCSVNEFMAAIAADGTLCIGDAHGLEQLWIPASIDRTAATDELTVIKRGSRYEVHVNGAKHLAWQCERNHKVCFYTFLWNAESKHTSMYVGPPAAPTPKAPPTEVF